MNSFINSLIIAVLFISFGLSYEAHALSFDSSHNYVMRNKLNDWSDKTSSVHWRLNTQARQYDRVTDSSTIFSTRLSGVLQYKFYDELRFFGQFDAIYQTGNAQSRFGDLSPRTGVFLSDSYFLISPFTKTYGDKFTIEVGALSQSRTLSNSVLISGNPFAGVSEVLRLKAGDLGLTFRAQQTIPFSQVENAQLAEREQTPYFLSESLRLSYDKKNYKISATGGLFQFSELPSNVAAQSEILGNSTTGNGNVAEFDYDFKGWFSNLRLDAMLTSKVQLQLRGYLVQNLEAPDRLDRGHDFKGAIGFHTKNSLIQPYYGVFSLEPDVSPAFYNASAFGNNNRDGWYAGLQIFVKAPTKLNVNLKYTKAELLNPNALQEDQQTLFLTLQTHFKQLGAW